MAILIEGWNVVIRNTTVEQRFPGGLAEYERRCPNDTFCTDGRVCRIGFMSADDVRAYIAGLVKAGFALPGPDGSAEIAWVSAAGGFVFPCDWLQVGQAELGTNQTAAVVWLLGTEPTPMIAPPRWKPNQMLFIAAADFSRLEFLRTEGAVEVYRDKETDKLVYVGRTQKNAPPPQMDRAAVQARIKALFEELRTLGAFPGVGSVSDPRAAHSCYERAKQLVHDTQATLPFALFLQGVAARALQQWAEAESLFRRVTELAPDQFDGWLELTWALTSLSRFDEAERAVRAAIALNPNHAGALTNLAVLLQKQGNFEEARSAAEKVLAVNPDDTASKNILQATKQVGAQNRPWWQRLFS